MQVDNAYNEFEGKVVADLGCGTVSVQLFSNCCVLLPAPHGLCDTDMIKLPILPCHDFV